MIRQRIEQRNFAAWEALGSSAADEETPSQTYARLRLRMIAAERAKVLEVRSQGSVPSEVVREVLAMLDIEESMLDLAYDTEDVGDIDRKAARAVGELCEDLERSGREAEPRTPRECEECVRDGTDGCTCGSAWTAGTSGAATPHLSGTRPPTSTTQATGSCSPTSPARPGAGASCTT